MKELLSIQYNKPETTRILKYALICFLVLLNPAGKLSVLRLGVITVQF